MRKRKRESSDSDSEDENPIPKNIRNSGEGEEYSSEGN